MDCERLGVDLDRYYGTLRQLGRKFLHRKAMEWSPDNPTQNYCYPTSEWLHRYYMPHGSRAFYVLVNGDRYGHRFNMFPGGSLDNLDSIIDLTAEQFGDRKIPYENARPRGFMMTHGPQPSKRAQLIEHVYQGNPPPASLKQFGAERGPWRNPPCQDTASPSCEVSTVSYARGMPWTWEETVILVNYLMNHRGPLRIGSPELAALRTELFPYRSEGSVHMHALALNAMLGYAVFKDCNPSPQIRNAAKLCKDDPDAVARMARDFELLRKIRSAC